MNIKKRIGDNIRIARKEAGLNQEELADMLNLSRTSMVNIEKGRQALTIPKLLSISKITGFSLASIIGDEGEKLPTMPELRHDMRLHQRLDEIDKKTLLAFLAFHKRINKD